MSKVFNVDFKIAFKSHIHTRTPIAHIHPLHTQRQVGSSITRLVAATESRHWPRPRRGYMNARTICMLYVCLCVCDGVCECVCQSFGCHTARFWWLALSECGASTVDNGPHLGARTANCHSPSAHTLPANATGNCRRHAALHQQQQQQHLPIQSVSQFQLLFNRLRHRRLASKWDFSICLTCRCHLSAHEILSIYLYMYVCNTLIYIRLFSQCRQPPFWAPFS